MAKQTFTAGQVLTATQMNNLQANDYNWTTSAQTSSYVLVAANAGQTVTMTSASATTITVNTSLFAAGDTVRILNLGAGTCTITAGTATVNSAGSLALPQYGSGTLWFSSASAAIFIPDDRTVATGLTLVKTQTIGSAVSSISVTNAFSSTYDNYKIVISGGVGSTALSLSMTLGASTTQYYYGGVNVNYTTGTVAHEKADNGSAWGFVGYANSSPWGIVMNMDINSPNLATATSATGFWYRSGGSFLGQNVLFHNVATAYTDFTLTTSTGTVTGGTIYVYGYAKS